MAPVNALADLPLRRDLIGRTPYGAPQHDVPVALNTNENTHVMPDEVAADIVERIRTALGNVNRYPDREFTALRIALARYLGHGIAPEQIWAANGSNEVIQHVLQAFGGPGRTVLGFPPSYSMHEIIAGSTLTGWVAGRRDAGFTLSPGTVVAEIARTSPDLVFLCAPNNPTGTPVPLETIEAAYDATDGIVFVDEAYFEFSSGESAITLLPGRERLIVSRTMSKAFAFAGARVGYLAAAPSVVDAMRLVRLPYHLSALTQAAAEGALAHAPTMLRMVGAIRGERQRVAAALTALGYHVWPSETNFLLFGGVSRPHDVWRSLLDRGVLVRDLAIEGSLRVSVGTPAENDAFLGALSEVGTPAVTKEEVDA